MRIANPSSQRTFTTYSSPVSRRTVPVIPLFGSVARDEQRPDSDIDILVDLDPAIVTTMFDYAGLKNYVASLFQGSVDVIDREALKPLVRPHATAGAIYAF